VIGLEVGQIEAQTLEKHAERHVGVLVGIENVRAVPIEHLRERGDDAASVGTGDEQCCELGGSRHGCGSSGKTQRLSSRITVDPGGRP
jgi:hypothetical protein